MSQAKARLDTIDAAKGLAIALVVWGHVVARGYLPRGNDWYSSVNVRLYAFHMAYFFFLAGFVYFMRADPDPWARWKKTARRLVPAYLLFGGLVLVGKLVAAHFLPVDRPVAGLSDELKLQLLYPTQGFASFLWFIVVVLEVQWAAFVLLRAVRQSLGLALAIAAVLHLLAVCDVFSEMFGLHLLCRYLLIYLLGALAARHREAFFARVAPWCWPLMLVFGLVLVFAPVSILPTVAGLLGLVALTALVLKFQQWGWGAWLAFLGINSFTIYLMNSLCMGLGRSLLLKTWGWDGWKFPPIAVGLWAIGLLLPVLVQRLVFARSPALNAVTR